MWWNRPRRIEIKVKQSSNYSQWRNFRDLVLSNNPARSSSPSPKTGQERSATFKSNSLFKPSHSAPSRSLTSSSTSQPKTSPPSPSPRSSSFRRSPRKLSRAGQIRIEFLFVVQLQSSSRSQRNAFKVNSDTIYNHVKLIIIYFSLSVIRIIFATNLCFLFAPCKSIWWVHPIIMSIAKPMKVELTWILFKELKHFKLLILGF